MMKNQLILLPIVLLCLTASLAEASPPDTTLTPSGGTICLFGKVYDGKEISFSIKDQKFVANVPGAAITVWQLPDPTTPPPEVPSEIIEKIQFMDAVNDCVYENNHLPLAQLRAILAGFSSTFCDSVVLIRSNQVMFYWHDGPELLDVAGMSNAEDKARATPASIRHGFTVYGKSIVKALNQGAVLFVTSSKNVYDRPAQLTFKNDAEKRQALFEVIQVLQGKTDNLRLLTPDIVAELRKQ
jgi:hypothetical protein